MHARRSASFSQDHPIWLIPVDREKVAEALLPRRLRFENELADNLQLVCSQSRVRNGAIIQENFPLG